jgi:hypothetical protein
MFIVNGKVVGMGAFGKASTFSRVFKNLLESYALDAVDLYEKEAYLGAGKIRPPKCLLPPRQPRLSPDLR